MATTEPNDRDRGAFEHLNDLLGKAIVRHAPPVSLAAIQSPEPTAASVRVAEWNIERGREWRSVVLALTDPNQFRQLVQQKQPISERQWREAAEEIRLLKRADILILNEVDLGMKRTGYANVAAELAGALSMSYAFGVEFLEVDPLYLGGRQNQPADPVSTRPLLEDQRALLEDRRVDPARYRGLHGNAILSRFPIRSARILRLPVCYDWFDGEIAEIAALEKGKRWSAKRVFDERIRRQVRRGGRMALIVEVENPSFPGGVLTVVSTHLEDRSKPKCRREQIETVLEHLRPVRGALVLGGDLNTTGADGTPTSFQREVTKRVTSRTFWGRAAIRWFSPVGLVSLMLEPLNSWKNLRDPTALSVPFVAPNRERGLFRTLREFRFDDGGRFDFRGDRRHSGNRRKSTLANSNQRAWKGFRSTFRFRRHFFNLVGSYRLDWLLVKPATSSGTELLQPHSPATLTRMNRLTDERLSDHDPIIVSLQSSRLSPTSLVDD